MMAHYAILNENNIVVDIIVGKDENDVLPEGYSSWEEYYGGKRCSYNTVGNINSNGENPFRGNYPGIGFIYDEEWDAFYIPQPYPSWKMNYQKFIWEPPIPKPEIEPGIGFLWRWSEVNKEWIQVQRPNV